MAKKSKKKSSRKTYTNNDDSSEGAAVQVRPAPEAEEVNLGKLAGALISSLRDDSKSGSTEKRDELIRLYIRAQLEPLGILEKYNVLVLYDEGRMVKSDADDIYSAASGFLHKKPVMLILLSSGGVVGSAYLIGKLCRECSGEKFVVAVPRQAKSAATLICCAADEIHMGSLSELGPIDPQIDNLPALGLKASVEHIADLVGDYPHASDMFAKYLNLSLEPMHLGYYERVAESAMQYAERLLRLHKTELIDDPLSIAKKLVYFYKDHGFVIDKAEAAEIFGDSVVKVDTVEYEASNKVYSALSFISKMSKALGYYFYFIGSPESRPTFHKISK